MGVWGFGGSGLGGGLGAWGLGHRGLGVSGQVGLGFAPRWFRARVEASHGAEFHASAGFWGTFFGVQGSGLRGLGFEGLKVGDVGVSGSEVEEIPCLLLCFFRFGGGGGGGGGGVDNGLWFRILGW